MKRWDQTATWGEMVRRLEELNTIPAERRTEAEERARYSIAQWLEGRTEVS